jgi:hypothetical protein
VPVRSRRRLAIALTAVLMTAAGTAPAALAADDVTPPVGSLKIGDGSGYASSLTVTLHAPATDDVAVTTMRIFVNGVEAAQRAYTSTVQWTFSQPGLWSVGIDWRDAAGNAAWDQHDVQVDTTAPELSYAQISLEDDRAPGILTATLHAWDDGSPITHARFRTGSGPWGAPIATASPSNPIVDWPALDPAYGGSLQAGRRTAAVQVRNAAGLWSTAVSDVTMVAFEDLPIDVSGDQRTGHAVTFTPRVPAGVTYPSNTFCRWTLFWGNDRSLYEGERDDTFGGIEIAGSKAAGYCAPWTVTVPWVPYRQFLVAFLATSGEDTIAEGGLGSSPDDPAFEPAVDSTSRHIRTSSLPLVYVLPDDYNLVVGVPATYRAYPIAGATIKSTDLWSVNYVDHPERKYGGSSFTFTPKIAGHITVCWHSDVAFPRMMNACYDPPARYPDRSAPNTTAPTLRYTRATATRSLGVEVRWSGTDKGWGIGSYKLQRSVDGGTWKTVTLADTTVTKVGQKLAFGHTYRYRVRATDKAGNVGAWDYGTTINVRRVRLGR